MKFSKSYTLLLLVFNIGILAAQNKNQKPNIIFLLTDDQTSISVGCYGNNQVQTPHMDGLAKEGVLFANHYNTTAICMASRVSILTGMYEYKTGVNFMHGDLTTDKLEKTYPVLLQNAGYFTGFAGKVGFEMTEAETDKIKDKLPLGYFDVWGGGPGQTFYQTAKNPTIAKYAKEYPHATRAYGAWAADFIKTATNQDKPFCMSISFKAPHLPFTTDKYFDYVYKGKTFTKPANYGEAFATYLPAQAKSGREYKDYSFWRDSEESYQKAISKYNQLIFEVDYTIGEIRKSLKQYGADENTIIIFTSDNGYSCGAHNLGGKELPYEEASKSPFIIYDPRAPKNEKGIKRETVTANIDIAPTILSYAGLPIPKNMDGENLLPLIKNPAGIKREFITLTNMWGNDEIQEMSVVSKDWKYIYWQYGSEIMKPAEELYYVGKDRLELYNHSKDPVYLKKLAEMRTIYDQHYDHLAKNIVHYNDYEKYIVLFDRKANTASKKPFLTGTYDELAKKGKGNE
ncbi:hypothetical protein FFWV33_15270 [Flavobacterium faecale]|uniref:Sulfatase N-terminal domain-containing protein n=1 Tax=Flavobacterium faecale TaxID=1355330 RepID=A0A2S1LGL1_9FLAO|nr:sulfatase-like hydrolase/transferase [Flavobacterium faecale]AWG22791.1 hypothetical protein FFWV33_15270 [Flavobacterium faecale]